tara:strand:- start:130 stop:399 length:270 start_codon:yes stop_codon:yes gene_type:complete
MSTEILTKENLKNPKFDNKGSEKTRSDRQFSNLDLNKVQKHTSSKNKLKICINTLNKNLRQKEIKEKFENRVLFGLVISAVAVLFYVST